MLFLQMTVSCLKPLIYQILLWTSSWPEFFDLFLKRKKIKEKKKNTQQKYFSPLKKPQSKTSEVTTQNSPVNTHVHCRQVIFRVNMI